MREIIFRGKCIDETCLKGQWLEGQMLHDGVTGKYYIHRDNCLNESDNVGEEGLLRFVAYEVAAETVCQYTGLTDKNGRKIFEGDILEICTFGFDPERFITEVIYEKCAFRLKNGRNIFYCGQSDFTKMDDAKVIGNIFLQSRIDRGDQS